VQQQSVKRRLLLRNTGLQPRDLRRIDPSAASNSAPFIVVRVPQPRFHLVRYSSEAADGGSPQPKRRLSRCYRCDPNQRCPVLSGYCALASPRLQKFRGVKPPLLNGWYGRKVRRCLRAALGSAGSQTCPAAVPGSAPGACNAAPLATMGMES